MQISENKMARAIALRDIAMRLIEQCSVDGQLTHRRDGVIKYRDARGPGYFLRYTPDVPSTEPDPRVREPRPRTNRYLHVAAPGVGSVLNMYWNDAGDVKVSRYVPGAWESHVSDALSTVPLEDIVPLQ